jgi:hypothetical protein
MLTPIKPLKLTYHRDGLTEKVKYYFYSIKGKIHLLRDNYDRFVA